MVWVRSLVPKEKKSAASAIRCAVSAARGSSIIVPIGIVSVDPGFGGTLRRGSASASSRTRCSSITEPDQRHHDLDLRVLAGLDLVDRGLGDRPDLQREQARRQQPSRTPRRPSIGFDSCSRSTAASSLRSASTCAPVVAAGLGQRHLDRQLGAVRQELVQRRVEQPDVHRQPVHRLQQLDEVLALQRQQRVQRRRRARRRCRPG